MSSMAQRFTAVRNQALSDFNKMVEANGAAGNARLRAEVNRAGGSLQAKVGGIMDKMETAFPELRGWGRALNNPADSLAFTLQSLGPPGLALLRGVQGALGAYAVAETAAQLANLFREHVWLTGRNAEEEVDWLSNWANINLLWGNRFDCPEREYEKRLGARACKAWFERSPSKGTGAAPILIRAMGGDTRLWLSWYEVNRAFVATLRANIVKSAMDAQSGASTLGTAAALIGYDDEAESCSVFDPRSCSDSVLAAWGDTWRPFFAASAYATAVAFGRTQSVDAAVRDAAQAIPYIPGRGPCAGLRGPALAACVTLGQKPKPAAPVGGAAVLAGLWFLAQ